MTTSSKRSKELATAISRTLYQQPFYAVLLLDLLEIHEIDGAVDPVAAAMIPTAGVNGKQCYVNKQWFAKLDPSEGMFVLCHEVLHVVLEHPARTKLYMDRGIGPDLKAFSPDKMNQAQDYIINDMLVQGKVGKMPSIGLHNPKIGCKDDLADDVYLKISDPPQGGDPGKGKTGNSGGTLDNHMPQVGGKQAAPSKSEIQRALKGAAMAAKSQGNMPAGMERLVKEICEPQVNWRDQLRTSITVTAGRDHATWARPNRKRLAVAPHVYLPGRASIKAGIVTCWDDTSGSVSDDERKHFFAEMSAIAEDLNPQELWIGSVDAEAYDPVLCESAEDVRNYVSRGGGGTDMGAVFPKLAELNIVPECCVILTDGYTPWGVQPSYPVVWVITDKSIVAPFGKTIHIDIKH